MDFHKIELQTWNRRESYHHFLRDTPCTYSMTVNLNITKLIETIKYHQLKFFPTVLHGISLIVNRHSEFRMDLDEQGNVGFYDCCHPDCAVFDQETETFTSVMVQYDADFHAFMKNYHIAMEEHQSSPKTNGQSLTKNLFNISCIPWTSFTGFQLNLQNGYDYLLPIFTIGKYAAEGGQTVLPVAIQIHHAVCDGFHTARFVNELQEWADSFSLFPQ